MNSLDLIKAEFSKEDIEIMIMQAPILEQYSQQEIKEYVNLISLKIDNRPGARNILRSCPQIFLCPLASLRKKFGLFREILNFSTAELAILFQENPQLLRTDYEILQRKIQNMLDKYKNIAIIKSDLQDNTQRHFPLTS
ncbi:MAG: hypothetical protein LBL34_04855 [Clostridiales bacterium]|nr:hypothetical protein [Clostridiales bacterium]